MYSKAIETILKKKNISPGDRIRVSKKPGIVCEGLLMPRIELGDSNALVLKLDNGYNMGVSFDSYTEIEKLKESVKLEALPKPTLPKPKLGKSEAAKGLPEIAVIATGGTIASRVDYKFGGVKAALDPMQLLSTTPELARIVNLKSISSPFLMFSENMSPKEWVAIARAAANELNNGAAGLIVTHGTDTLHYTAAALSFMLKNLSKPVALTGAQRSPDRGSFDGAMNLVCSAHYAKSNIAEVAVVMHGTSSDDYCIAIRGTKARKMHSSRRDAFRPVNDVPIAKIWPDGRLEAVQRHRERSEAKVVADVAFENKIALIKAYPGSDPRVIDFFVDKKYRGIVVEATAMGQVPVETSDEELSWLPAVKRAREKGVEIAFATQCLYGRASPFVYEPAREMHALGVIHCGDMLPEVAYVKLGFVLGHFKKHEDVKREMLRNYAGELNPRLTEKDFLV